MAVFTVLSEKPQQVLRAAIEREFPDNFYHWSDTVSFVAASGTAKRVAMALGVKARSEDGEVTGSIGGVVVSTLSPSYFGWSKAALWEWLKTNFEAVN
ncbi:hypothetical protein KZ810_03310 [Sphingomonas sp. RHCKR47]|uniref:hypothetical protein n=1 Tax=Sphingomonas citricola TaxID=2862498 RepID=UPI001CA4931D|nr:hypothetical protein [Sphingomonas citricola]MBW6522515.1 hypothetical protein [Sphingomonas citricola]